jgi:glycosyltransferase involved in cell wall biosynthesis
MKLVIMIPCLNEETTLPLTLSTIPRKIPGVDSIDILVIDDGCTDKTVEVAKNLGVKHFIHHANNRGLAMSLRDGLMGALELGADILVLTDGDNQYPQERIPDLIQPILDGEAETVIADRQTSTIEHFSPIKKFLQKFGTQVLNTVAKTDLPDSTSGFRAYSKEAAIKINMIGRFNFALETTLQASHKRMAIKTIKIKTNPKTRESRLFKSIWQHVRKSAVALINSFLMYRPYLVFITFGFILLIAGLVPFVHLFLLWLSTRKENGVFGAHHLQLLIVGSVMLNAAFVSFTLGIVANLIGINRSLTEDILEEIRRARFNMASEVQVPQTKSKKISSK